MHCIKSILQAKKIWPAGKIGKGKQKYLAPSIERGIIESRILEFARRYVYCSLGAVPKEILKKKSWENLLLKHIFIVNPVSGKEDAGRLLVPQIIQACKNTGVEWETIPTKAPKHATRIVQQYSQSGEEIRFYAVGGDGTLNEVLLGAYPFKSVQVASVPCGSGNDFVRNFGQAQDFLDLQQQIAGTPVPVDLIQVNGGVSAAITSCGLDAEIAYNIPKYRRVPFLGGTMAYNISIVEKLLKPIGKKLRITVDGEILEGNYLITAVCNGQTYGGGYRAAPCASLEDGLLDFVLVKKISRFKIASIIGKYKKGEHIVEDLVAPGLTDVIEYRRAKEICIEPLETDTFIINIDGECGPAKRLYAKVMPGAARFVLPKGIYHQHQKQKLADTTP